MNSDTLPPSAAREVQREVQRRIAAEEVIIIKFIDISKTFKINYIIHV